MLLKIRHPTSVIKYLFVGISRWLFSAVVFYHKWIPYLQSRRYVSGVFAVDDSTVTRVNVGLEKQSIESMFDKTLVVFYFIDSMEYAIMIDPAKFNLAKDALIPYSKEFRARPVDECDDYLAVEYEGEDVTAAFLMYLGPLKNSHCDKDYALTACYSRMIDNKGNLLFKGKANTAFGILRSDFSTIQHIKIFEDPGSEDPKAK